MSEKVAYRPDPVDKMSGIEGHIPHFVQYQVCIGCQGRGWKREKDGYSMITCPFCMGKKKLPMTGADGQWIKR